MGSPEDVETRATDLATTEQELAEPVAIVLHGAGGDEPPRGNPVHVYLASLDSENSRRTAKDSLRRALRMLDKPPARWASAPWWVLQVDDVTLIRGRLVERFGVSTARLTLSVLRAVLFRCFLLGYLDGDAFERLTAWPRIRGSSLAAGRMLSDEEIERIHQACLKESAFVGAMDQALFDLGLSGLRRDELARSLVEDVADDCKSILVRGKGRKQRRVPLDFVGAVLEGWLAQRARFPFTTPFLFVFLREGNAEDHGLSKWQVWQRLKRLGALAGVKFTPHDLRRTCASELLDHTDVVTVQGILGHADPRTTARYDRRPEMGRANAMKHLNKWAPKPARSFPRSQRGL